VSLLLSHCLIHGVMSLVSVHRGANFRILSSLLCKAKREEKRGVANYGMKDPMKKKKSIRLGCYYIKKRLHQLIVIM
jgi:hypothetical protein